MAATKTFKQILSSQKDQLQQIALRSITNSHSYSTISSTSSSSNLAYFKSFSTAADSTSPDVGNPLEILKSISQKYGLCDENGFRAKNRHWTFALSIIDCDDKNIEMKKVSSYIIKK